MLAAAPALALAGCAFDPDAGLIGELRGMYGGGATEVAVIGEEPVSATRISETHVDETVTWGEPTVVPAGFAGGPHAVADTDGPGGARRPAAAVLEAGPAHG